jgi:hypothetical protein
MYYHKEDFNNIHESFKNDIMNDITNDTEDVIMKSNDNRETVYNYIILDSYVKLRSSDTLNGEFKWIFNTQGDTTDESIGVLNNIDFVKKIKIGSFYIPIIEDVTYIDPTINTYGIATLVQNNTSPFNTAPTLVRKAPGLLGQYPLIIFSDPTETYKIPWINNPYTQIPFSNRLSIQIKETNLQSYSTFNGKRYNFECISTYDTKIHNNSSFLQITPISGWDTYNFNNPLRNLNSISIIFRNPDNVIRFEPDVMYRSIINLTADGTGSHITITTQYEHKLLAGDRIYIKNFIPVLLDNSPNENFPKHISNYITRDDGHTVNSIAPGILPSYDPYTVIPGTSFGLDPSLKILDPISPDITISFPSLVDVFIAKRRLRIPIEITSTRENIKMKLN